MQACFQDKDKEEEDQIALMQRSLKGAT